MGMGERGWRPGPAPCGRREWFFPAGRPPGTLQSRFKETTGQVLPSLPTESDTRIKHLPERRRTGDWMVLVYSFLKGIMAVEGSRHRNGSKKIDFRGISWTLY